MRILSLLILFVIIFLSNRQPESPHGPGFKVSCSNCHSSAGWELDKKIYSFNHNKTKLPLTGQHSEVDCKMCHPTLVFADAGTGCIDCHTDIHQATVGLDCSRCHTTASWLVNDITGLHQRSRFPLLGPHRSADCYDCHKSESMTRFDVVGINCIDCHRQDYLSTSNPNHVQAGFSNDCLTCHPVNSFKWSGAGFDHAFFALVEGHSIPKCEDCHTTGNYSDSSPECNSCHHQDFLATTNPNHAASAFPLNCSNCHTLIPGWKPAGFDHSKFPLTLGHSGIDCTDCHKGGNYSSTSPDCVSCHNQDFVATTNPNHAASNFPLTCSNCHTVNPGWKPASFDHSKFPLTQGHSGINCTDCHKGGNYSSTSPDCVSCHKTDYDNSLNPRHPGLNFSLTCTMCHTTQPDWKPATYTQHDSQSFPIYSGAHRGEWNNCTDCHANTSNYSQFTCINCHEHNKADMDSKHNGRTGYSYDSPSCFRCHPTGRAD